MSKERRLFQRAGLFTVMSMVTLSVLTACGASPTATVVQPTATTAVAATATTAAPTATTAAVATATKATTAATATTGSSTGKKLKIGLVTDVGRLNDKSFNQSSWEGVQKAGSDLGDEIKSIETTDTKD